MTFESDKHEIEGVDSETMDLVGDIVGDFLRTEETDKFVHEKQTGKGVKKTYVYLPPGTRFGKLTVECQAKYDDSNHGMFFCKCDCGNEVIVRGSNLLTGNTKSCGCLRKQKHVFASRKKKPRKIPYGAHVANWLVGQEAPWDKKHRCYWCVCQLCGEEYPVREEYLLNGKSRSCRNCRCRLIKKSK
jgi:hypothetical protein